MASAVTLNRVDADFQISPIGVDDITTRFVKARLIPEFVSAE
jgi:hypothetical protein